MDLQAIQELNKRQIMMSYGMEAVMGDSLSRYDGGKTIQHKDLQEAVDSAIEGAKQGSPVWINFAGQSAEVPSLLRGEVMKEVEPPDGIHILQAPRIGDEARNKYLERLQEAAGGGYINLTETGARQDEMLKAETQEQLERLVKDLPPRKPDLPVGTKIYYPEKKKEHAWTGPGVIVPALAALLGCYDSVLAGIHGSFPELIPSLVITGLFVFLLCIGIAKGKSSGTP